MKISKNKIISLALTALTSFSFLSPVLALDSNRELEEVKSKKVNKRGNLVIKFCSKLKDYNGFVSIDDQKFQINEANIIKPRKIVWKDVNLPKQKGKNINTENLLARYFDDSDNSQPLTVLEDGECGIGILPLIVIGAGIAVGAGSGGGSGSSSSN